MRTDPGLAAGLLAIALFLFPGCSKQVSKVSGRVTVKGEPIVAGRIVFIAEDGRLDSAQILDGAYLVSRAPIGNVKITITGTPPASNKPRVGAGKPERFVKPETGPNKKFVDVPKKYSDEKTTDLTYEVKSGKQEYNIDLPAN